MDTHAKNVLSIQSRSEDITEKVAENGFNKPIWHKVQTCILNMLKNTLEHGLSVLQLLIFIPKNMENYPKIKKK